MRTTKMNKTEAVSPVIGVIGCASGNSIRNTIGGTYGRDLT